MPPETIICWNVSVWNIVCPNTVFASLQTVVKSKIRNRAFKNAVFSQRALSWGGKFSFCLIERRCLYYTLPRCLVNSLRIALIKFNFSPPFPTLGLTSPHKAIKVSIAQPSCVEPSRHKTITKGFENERDITQEGQAGFTLSLKRRFTVFEKQIILGPPPTPKNCPIFLSTSSINCKIYCNLCCHTVKRSSLVQSVCLNNLFRFFWVNTINH